MRCRAAVPLGYVLSRAAGPGQVWSSVSYLTLFRANTGYYYQRYGAENRPVGEDSAVAALAGVRVETVELDAAGTRQISPRHRTTAALQERRGDIEAAVSEACRIVQESVAKVDAQHGWRVSTLEAKFGLTLAAEAGVIVSRASAEASFEVTVTIERA